MTWIHIDHAEIDRLRLRVHAASEVAIAVLGRAAAANATPGLGSSAGLVATTAANFDAAVRPPLIVELIEMIRSVLQSQALLKSESAGAAPGYVATVGTTTASVFAPAGGMPGVVGPASMQEVLYPSSITVGGADISPARPMQFNQTTGRWDPESVPALTSVTVGPHNPSSPFRSPATIFLDAAREAERRGNSQLSSQFLGASSMMADKHNQMISNILRPDPDADGDGIRDSMDPKPFDRTVR